RLASLPSKRLSSFAVHKRFLFLRLFFLFRKRKRKNGPAGGTVRKKPKITNRSDLREKGIAYIKTRRLESALLLPQQKWNRNEKKLHRSFFSLRQPAAPTDVMRCAPRGVTLSLIP
ncbi:MAG: hypothetical protein IJU56_08005, partial [Clostridia bacterium]|nr:hypothetical protein [Clostridia bacterium]